MKKYLLIFYLLSLPAFAQITDYAKDGFPPLVPQNNTTVINNYKYNINNGLNKLERKIFNKTYENDLLENRISRLEEQIMGTIQSGDLNSRYNILKKAVNSYSANSYNQVANPYCGVPIMTSGGGWRGLAGSLGNFFSGNYQGYPTGLSPQIMSPYINNYGPDYSRGFYSNHGWTQNNIYRGSNTGVTILD